MARSSIGAAIEIAGIRLVRDTEFRWVVPRSGNMEVPGVVFASEDLLPTLGTDQSLQQVVNVARLAGIVRASYAMPDIHWGYGLPIGGVAAREGESGGIVPRGGVGLAMWWGSGLLVSNLQAGTVMRAIPPLMDELYRAVPAGQGTGGIWALSSRSDLEQVLREGARAAVRSGYGTDEDLTHCEDRGALPVDDLDGVTDRALERGRRQLGSLGSGNHFLEVQEVERVIDAGVARRFGLAEGSVTVMIHSGSRGLGHQICSDHVEQMLRAMPEYGIK